MSLRNLKSNLTSTESTKTLKETEREEFIRHELSSQEKAELKKRLDNPNAVIDGAINSPAMKAMLKGKDGVALDNVNLPKISAERILPRSQLIPAPNDWNFFGPPSPSSFYLMITTIEQSGLFSPIVVWERSNNQYMILAGHSREKAFDTLYQLRGDSRWLQIPSKIYSRDSLDEIGAQIIIIASNLAQRANEGARVRFKATARLISLMRNYSYYGSGIDIYEQVAKILGVSRAIVFQSLRIMKLITPLLDMVYDGKISRRNADVLCRLPKELQEHLAALDVADKLTKFQILKLKKAKTIEDVDYIIAHPEKDELERCRVNVTIKNLAKRPKGSKVMGLCLPKENVDECYDIFRKAIDTSSLSPEVKNFILKQLQT